MDYYLKYMKYKIKYLEAKEQFMIKQFGGLMKPGLQKFIRSLPDLKESADSRPDHSFPDIDPEYINSLIAYIERQNSSLDQLNEIRGDLTKDEFKQRKIEVNRSLSTEERNLKGDPMWANVMNLKEVLSTHQLLDWNTQKYIDGGINLFEDIRSRLEPAIEKFLWLKKNDKITYSDEHLELKDFNSLSDLENLLDRYTEALHEKEGIEEETIRGREGGELLYDGADIKIIRPITKEGACYYGKGTRWCTAATTSSNMFDNYNSRGPLYIIQPKNPEERNGRQEKYQLHFRDDMYMDETDTSVNMIDLIRKFPELTALEQYEPDFMTKLMTNSLNDNDFESVKFFIDRGVDINTFNEYGYNPLSEAVDSNDEVKVSKLLEYGADPNIKNNLGISALTNAIHSNARIDIIELLLKHRADPNIKDENSQAPLNIAVSNDSDELVRLFLKYGADVTLQNSHTTLIEQAYYNNNVLMIELLLDAGADGSHILHIAVVDNNLPVVDLLLRKGVNPNIKDSGNDIALMAAVHNENQEMIRLLLDNGADVNILDKYDSTPLNVAIYNNSPAVFNMLLEKANEHTKNLALGAAVQVNQKEMVQILLEKGADPHIIISYGDTAYDMASDEMKQIFDNGMQINPGIGA
jgi:ankyrin repeat protein